MTISTELHISDRQSIEKSSSTFFSGLNQFRFICAFAVLIFHIEHHKGVFGLENSSMSSVVFLTGHEGLRGLFVLSGFLITYLLLVELKENRAIDIGRFYLRRMLRIWPLYYLCVGLAFFVVPYFLYTSPHFYGPYNSAVKALPHHFWEKLGLYVAFLPNYVIFKYPGVIGAVQCWSLGPEEQFYLLWPFLLTVFKRRILLGFGVALGIKFGIIAILNLVLSQYAVGNTHNSEILRQIIGTVDKIDTESFVVGGCAAYLLVHHFDLLKRITGSWFVGWSAVIATVCCNVVDFPYRGLVATIAYAWMISSLCINSKRRTNVGKRWLDGLNTCANYLGRISYGIYIFHPIVIVLVLQAFGAHPRFATSHPNIASFIMYVLCISLSVAVSSFSYKFFETPILKLKDRFAA